VQELASSPSLVARPIPYGLMSLWDMINFTLHEVYAALEMLATQLEVSRAADPNGSASEGARRIALMAIARAEKAATTLGLKPPFDWVRRTRSVVTSEQGITNSTLAHQLDTLRSWLADEMRREYFYHYPRQKAELLLQIPNHWSLTFAAFPCARPDIEAGVDCYALGHATACV
jgi:hypothetical protein